MKTLRTAALVLSTFSLGTTGCSTQPADTQQQAQDTASASFSIGARDIDAVLGTTTQGRRLSALVAPAFSYVDVARITIDVKEKDTGNILYVNFDLFVSADAWTGTIPFLPKNKALTFHARAYNSDGKLLFSGTTDQTLAINNDQVVITLAPANDGESITLARIKKIAIPSAFGSDQSGNVSFSVEARTGEKLTYTIIPADGGGTFYPLTGSITLAATAGTFVSQYAPPTVELETTYEHTVKVTNESGHTITTTFRTKVKPPGKTEGVKDTTLAVLFNPVINSLTASRVTGTSNVLFKADVADDGTADSLSYAWSFTPEGTFDPAPVFTDATLNPANLENYTTKLQGTLTLQVTDAEGGKTTLHYPLTPDQFPDNPVAEGPVTGINSIRAGQAHTCALFNNGSLRCFGEGGNGQLGYGNTFDIGDTEQPYSAGDVPLVGVGTKLSVGGNHTCALLDTGFVRCWGANGYGQLGYNLAVTENVGDGEAIASYGYVNLGGIAVKLAAGQDHTCALMDTGKVRCWGRNDFGQLGYGNKDNIGDNEQPWKAGDVDVGGTVRDIVAGGFHTCALMDTGKVRCWGRNDFGQLGYANTNPIGDTEMPAIAGDVNVGGTVLQLTAGNLHTCALLDTGFVRCWGNNENGRLGYGNYSYYNHYGYHNYSVGDNETPASVGDVNTGSKVLQVAAGSGHTCALLSTGGIKCWGYNAQGQLGLGNATTTYAPSTEVGLDGVTAFQLTTGANHTCALLSTGAARCWGQNSSGQVGIGNNTGNNVNLGDNEQVSTVADVQLLTPPSTP